MIPSHLTLLLIQLDLHPLFYILFSICLVSLFILLPFFCILLQKVNSSLPKILKPLIIWGVYWSVGVTWASALSFSGDPNMSEFRTRNNTIYLPRLQFLWCLGHQTTLSLIPRLFKQLPDCLTRTVNYPVFLSKSLVLARTLLFRH